MQITVTTGPKYKGLYKYFLDIEADTIVIFFWMETDLEKGYFEENGIMLTQNVTRVNYLSKFDMPTTKLKQSITYQYYCN